MPPWNTETAQQYGELGEQSHIPILAEAIREAVDLRDQRVLDFGCGDGRLLMRLVEQQPPRQVRAIDVSGDLLSIARQEAAKLPGDGAGRVTFKRGDETLLPTDQKFDIALCSLTLMMIGDRDRLHHACRGLMRSLAPGGTLVLTLTHPCFRRAEHAAFHNDLPDDFRYWQSGRPYDVVLDPQEKQVEATLSDYHWTLTDYAAALADAGGAITALRELPGQYDTHGKPVGQPAYVLMRVQNLAA